MDITATTLPATTPQTFVPQTITLADVVRDGMQAWVDGTLALAKGISSCCYHDAGSGTRCIVGTAMTEATIQRLHDFGGLFGSVDTIYGNQSINVPSIDDMETMRGLQMLHDKEEGWALHERLTQEAERLGIPFPEGFLALKPKG